MTRVPYVETATKLSVSPGPARVLWIVGVAAFFRLAKGLSCARRRRRASPPRLHRACVEGCLCLPTCGVVKPLAGRALRLSSTPPLEKSPSLYGGGGINVAASGPQRGGGEAVERTPPASELRPHSVCGD